MRKDMPKLLCEDGRLGGGYAKLQKRTHRRRLNRANPEDLPKRESFSGRRNYGWDAKELNENLNPLLRFLKSKVGKDWDKTYSEIRENLRIDDPVQLHIMEHLWGYVDRHVVVADCGTLVKPERYVPYRADEGTKKEKRHHERFKVNGRKGWTPVYRGSKKVYSSYKFFIHPETRVLWSCKDQRLPTRPDFSTKDEKKTTHRFQNRHFFCKKNVWYEYDVVPLPKGVNWGETNVPDGFIITTVVQPTYSTLSLKKGGEPRVIRPGHEIQAFGPHDMFFGHVGGETRFSLINGPLTVRPSLKKVREAYGSLRVYCPGTYKQVPSKELRRVGLK